MRAASSCEYKPINEMDMPCEHFCCPPVLFSCCRRRSPHAQPIFLPRHRFSQSQAAYNWTGFYLGAHVGAGWASNGWDAPFFINLGGPLRLGAGSASGFLGGVQAGVNYQIDAMVFGLEADASWAQLSGEACNTIQGAVHCTSAANRFGTVTGRFGIAADRALVYLKGGAAWLHDEHTLSILGALDTTVSGNRWGWTAGAGIEYALTRNWSAKLEYDFMDFGTQQHLFVTTLVGTLNSTIAVKEQIQTAKFGLNYKFDWPPPARAANDRFQTADAQSNARFDAAAQSRKLQEEFLTNIRLFSSFCALGSLLYAVLAFLPVTAFGQPLPAELKADLRLGGYVIVLRHGATVSDQARTDSMSRKDVPAQRQLNEQGRAQAKSIGESMRKLKIPVALVLTSTVDRALDTGRLLGFGEVTATADLAESEAEVSPNERNRRAQALRKLVAQRPPADNNVVIVSHKPNLVDAFGS